MRSHVIDVADEKRSDKSEYPNIYAAIPANGEVCQHTGLKHAHLYKLLGEQGAARDFVRVVNLRNPTARHGKTLFNVGDMLRFLDHIAMEQGTATKRSDLEMDMNRNPPSGDRNAAAGY